MLKSEKQIKQRKEARNNWIKFNVEIVLTSFFSTCQSHGWNFNILTFYAKKLNLTHTWLNPLDDTINFDWHNSACKLCAEKNELKAIWVNREEVFFIWKLRCQIETEITQSTHFPIFFVTHTSFSCHWNFRQFSWEISRFHYRPK